MQKEFTIVITTRNRLDDLRITLKSLDFLLNEVEIIICDDGSTDGTFKFLKTEYSQIKVFRNRKCKGLIYSRNLLLNSVQTKFAISLDDDANFLSESPLEILLEHFNRNLRCGVIGFRIFWGKMEPTYQMSSDKVEQVKGYVGCGHAWRMHAWEDIPDYPDWFIFYGEEEFASYHLFKKNWKIHYAPEILVQHRVDNSLRRKNKDFIQRTRRSLRAGWFLYIMFLPWKFIPEKMGYSLWMQLKLKVFKGDGKSSIGILQAVGDLLFNLPKLIRNRRPLTTSEYKYYLQLPDAKLYWKPEK